MVNVFRLDAMMVLEMSKSGNVQFAAKTEQMKAQTYRMSSDDM